MHIECIGNQWKRIWDAWKINGNAYGMHRKSIRKIEQENGGHLHGKSSCRYGFKQRDHAN